MLTTARIVTTAAFFGTKTASVSVPVNQHAIHSHCVVRCYQSLVGTVLNQASNTVVYLAENQLTHPPTVSATLAELDIHSTLRVLVALLRDLRPLPESSSQYEALRELQQSIDAVSVDLEVKCCKRAA